MIFHKKKKTQKKVIKRRILFDGPDADLNITFLFCLYKILVAKAIFFFFFMEA